MSALAAVRPTTSYKSVLDVAHVSCEAKGIGQESITIRNQCRASVLHFTTPFSRQWASPAMQFETYRQQWEEETKFFSSVADIAMNSSYQKIIGMGEKALPLILAELKKKPAHWFWALRAISGEDPVRPEQKGRIKQMAEVWIKWGEEKGLIKP